MNGIVRAGGSGTRLGPVTKAVSKQLMPVYDKPMIYHPLSTLMIAGIREILIITTSEDSASFQRLLGDGSALGCSFSYKVQEVPNGLAQAFVIGKEFIGQDKVALVLGDNIFYGRSFGRTLRAHTDPDGAIVFAYYVSDPERDEVVNFEADGEVQSMEEKQDHPRSNYDVRGLYFEATDVVGIDEGRASSERGEYEITDVNKEE